MEGLKSEACRRARRTAVAFIALAGLTVVFAVWNLHSGSAGLSGREIWKILLRSTGDRDSTAFHIVWDIRMPRILAAVILGGALSVSGFLLQTFFANPIAGPFVLGISSGAELVVSLLMIYALRGGTAVSSLSMILAAFAGSMISMGFVLLISGKVRNMSMLVICGMMISYICSAVTDFLITFADDSNIVNLRSWSMGSFSGMSWENIKVMAAVTALAFFFLIFMAKPMGAYQLGEVYAQSMGVKIKRFRILLILLSSILSACVTAFAGPVSFVGIAVPHLMKWLFHTARPVVMMPACFIGGAVFCLFCDWIARNVFSPTEMSISSVTAIFGAPIVIYMMVHQRRGN